jgi:hypothetical protein
LDRRRYETLNDWNQFFGQVRLRNEAAPFGGFRLLRGDGGAILRSNNNLATRETGEDLPGGLDSLHFGMETSIKITSGFNLSASETASSRSR